jgi:hypothetical protein
VQNRGAEHNQRYETAPKNKSFKTRAIHARFSGERERALDLNLQPLTPVKIKQRRWVSAKYNMSANVKSGSTGPSKQQIRLTE